MIRRLSEAEVADLMARPFQAAPAAPAPICQLWDSGRELATVFIDAEPALRDVERLALHAGVALLYTWLKPANCTGPR